MRWIIACLATTTLAIACGGGDSEPAGDDMPAVGAAAQKKAAEKKDMEMGATTGEATHPSVGTCLDLVADGRFADAVDPCLEAVRRAPGNTEVKAALAKAQGMAGKAMEGAGAAAAAAGEEADEAAAGARSMLGDAKKKLPEM